MSDPAERPPQSTDSRGLRPTKGHWGRRKRRLRRVATLLVAVGLGAAVVGVLAYQRSRPRTHRPGEELPEITKKLSRDLPAEAPAPRLPNVTSEAGLAGFRTFEARRTSQLPEDMGSGAAWGDFDNDGDDDLFLVSVGGAVDQSPDTWASSQLYENRGDGTFRRVAAFPELRIVGMAAAWGDYDSDGRLDLVVAGYNSLLLFRNGEEGFVRDNALPEPPGFWAGASWGDFDNDRDLDLYLTGYVRYVEEGGDRRRTSEQYGAMVPYTLNPASYEPERNLLFRNSGDGTFTEVAESLGVANPEGRSLTALWHDFDDDGWLDLYVANDISDNALYSNRAGTFEDVSLAAWVADYRGAMGLAAGDWNRDGDDDLFITHWIAQENALYDSLLKDMHQRVAAADQGASQDPIGEAGPPPRSPMELAFSDRAAPVGLGQVALPFVGWGTEFADFDGDGWLDLIVANGSTFETETEPRGLKPQVALLFWNQRGEHFYNLAPLSEVLSTPHVARGLALSDYDNDGDVDILMVHHGEGVQLLRNDMQHGNWLKVRLRSRVGRELKPIGFGDGATLIVHLGDIALRRAVTSSSYLSQSSRTVHFGLGEAPRVDRLDVRWLGGETETYTDLEANSVWVLTEGDPVPRKVNPGTRLEARERLAEFWSKQRAAMDAMKKEGDTSRAIELFREALALNPAHEDSRYYLANSLALDGRVEEALQELDTLRRINPQSHRAHKQWGVLRARAADAGGDLGAAEKALERALELNPEETGSLLVLGEIALMQGDDALADQRFEWACRTNPRAIGGFFLRAYVAWKQGEREASIDFLLSARLARGEEWKPVGAVAEGDAARRMHQEETPLSAFWETWDGSLDPSVVFGSLNLFLSESPKR